MLKTYIMCGLAFSGKTTAANLIAAELDLTLISLDTINHERGLFGGEGIPVAEWERTSSIAMERLEAAVSVGESVLVDDTFSRRFLRERAKMVATKFGAKFLVIYIDPPIGVIEQRRNQNYQMPTRHHVCDEVFDEHRKSFQHPDNDEAFFRVASESALSDWIIGERGSQ